MQWDVTIEIICGTSWSGLNDKVVLIQVLRVSRYSNSYRSEEGGPITDVVSLL